MTKPEHLVRLIVFLRGERVMLDRDLARLYGVEARVLNQAVRRNRARFPSDFMFRCPRVRPTRFGTHHKM